MAEAGTLHNASIDELRDAYDAERQLTKALSKSARPPHRENCERPSNHIWQRPKGKSNDSKRCLQAWTKRGEANTAMGSRASTKKANRSWRRTSTTPRRMRALFSAGQRAEHYEMAAYGTLVAWARAMGRTEAVDLLQQTLDEEIAADEKLSLLAEGGINQEAADGAHGEDQQDAESDDEEDDVEAPAKKRATGTTATVSARRR